MLDLSTSFSLLLSASWMFFFFAILSSLFSTAVIPLRDLSTSFNFLLIAIPSSLFSTAGSLIAEQKVVEKGTVLWAQKELTTKTCTASTLSPRK